MKRVIATPDAPKAVGPYSQAIEVNGTLYIRDLRLLSMESCLTALTNPASYILTGGSSPEAAQQ